MLSRITAPPRKQHAVLWALLAAGSAIVVVMASATGGVGTVVVSAVGLLAAVFAVRAARYNATEYPKLHQLWEQSHMCTRCGDVFTA